MKSQSFSTVGLTGGCAPKIQDVITCTTGHWIQHNLWETDQCQVYSQLQSSSSCPTPKHSEESYHPRRQKKTQHAYWIFKTSDGEYPMAVEAEILNSCFKRAYVNLYAVRMHRGFFEFIDHFFQKLLVDQVNLYSSANNVSSLAASADRRRFTCFNAEGHPVQDALFSWSRSDWEIQKVPHRSVGL